MAINRNAPCPCGSGKKFKNCHGALNASTDNAIRNTMQGIYEPNYGAFKRKLTEPDLAEHFLSDMPVGLTNTDRAIPPGFIVMENFISGDFLEKLRVHAAETEGSTAKVVDIQKSNKAIAEKFDSIRITEMVPIDPLTEEFWKITIDAYHHVVEHFDTGIAWLEPPGILRYRKGGTYNSHSDSEFWDTGTQSWIPNLDRDFSLLIYLNSDFEGGAIYFDNFDLRIKPTAGMLVAFPSDHRYLHTAEPVTAGERYAVVGWSASDEKPKRRPPPEGALVIDDLPE